MTTTERDPQYYSTNQVAVMLSVTNETVRNWIEAGKLKAIKPGAQYRIERDDLFRFIEQRRLEKEVKLNR